MERFRHSVLYMIAGAALAMMAGCGELSDEVDLEEAESPSSFAGEPVYDAGTLCTRGGVTMHCCPTDYVMIGAHIDNNVFKCAPLAGTPGRRFADFRTNRNGMHACPVGSVMAGLHVDRNVLTCQSWSPGVVSEYVDGNPATVDAYPMHVCGAGIADEYAMTGIHVDRNLFTCGR
jgi:hypothetical protein